MKTSKFNTDNFLGEYNQLLSKALNELNYSQPAIASPTLNKQETITFLYKNICDNTVILPAKNIFFFLKI
jgi:hypothetical protein